VADIREVLTPHNELEEGPDGFYAVCEEALSLDAAEILAEIAAAPSVPLRPLPRPGERPRPRPLDPRVEAR
jgi:hypothetical protein